MGTERRCARCARACATANACAPADGHRSRAAALGRRRWQQLSTGTALCRYYFLPSIVDLPYVCLRLTMLFLLAAPCAFVYLLYIQIPPNDYGRLLSILRTKLMIRTMPLLALGSCTMISHQSLQNLRLVGFTFRCAKFHPYLAQHFGGHVCNQMIQ